MTTIVKSIDRTITSEEIIPLLNKYGMLSQLIREDIIDRAIADIHCTPQEVAIAYKLWEKLTIKHPHKKDFLELAIRKLKIAKFKQDKWGDQIPAYFARRKRQLDRVAYSVIKTKTREIAREMHFRLIEAEQTFTELAAECKKNPQIEVQAAIAELGTLPALLAKQLATLKTNSPSYPIKIGDWFAIVYLERYISAQCDRAMQQRLQNELFEAWMQKQLTHQKYHLENINLSLK